nr:hypothetical protein HAGR004_07430 [Bdellovibrio sp. HAGR004]
MDSGIKSLLQTAITALEPLDLASIMDPHACVALILRGQSEENLELGFIQRAQRPGDRWSGQLAFPGGKREAFDITDLDAAFRETLEEIGVRLSSHELLGRLDDIQARKAGTLLDFYIRPFVFYTEQNFHVTLDANEVADYFWVPLKNIRDPQRQTVYKVQRENMSIELPAVYLDREPPLWGLSYMMTLNLFERLHRLLK